MNIRNVSKYALILKFKTTDIILLYFVHVNSYRSKNCAKLEIDNSVYVELVIKTDYVRSAHPL